MPIADPSHPFADVIEANQTFSATYTDPGLKAQALKGLAVLTCMDSRIDPLAVLGLSPGDAKILRNAGARVTDDVLRTLVLARYLLGVDRVMVMAHTGCRMTAQSERDVHGAIHDAGGPDTGSLSFLTTPDQRSSLISDVQKIRSYLYLPQIVAGAFMYHIDSGILEEINDI
jgi:carbonic anhydrase